MFDSQPRTRQPTLVVIFVISTILLVGMLWANVEARVIYKTAKLPLIAGRSANRNIFQKSLLRTPSTIHSDVPYASKVTGIRWDQNFPGFENNSAEDCRVCATGIFDPAANSSPRDLVIGFGQLKAEACHLLVESLRGVKSQARTVFLVTDTKDTIINLHRRLTFDPCQATIINVGEISADYPLDIAKHLILSRFLTLFQRSFDRVLIVDFDTTVVQADPFVSYWDGSVFGVAAMAQRFDDVPDLVTSIKALDGLYDIHKEGGLYSKLPISDRIVYGSVPAVLTFYSVLFSHEDFKSGNFKASFAAYMNFIHATKGFELAGLTPKVLQIGDDFCSLYQAVEVKYVTEYKKRIPIVTITGSEPFHPVVIESNPSVSYVAFAAEHMCIQEPRRLRPSKKRSAFGHILGYR